MVELMIYNIKKMNILFGSRDKAGKNKQTKFPQEAQPLDFSIYGAC